MHAIHWLLGCGLCIASVGVTATALSDTQDLDSSTRTSVDSGSARDVGSTTGSDVLGIGHDTGHHGGADTTTDSSGNSGRTAGDSTPTRARSGHVGWQSLLPGSIQ